jgi:sugar-specific transcriptional regulator TrmB
MKNDKLLNSLADFGLEENEARVYLAALSQGATTILKLSKDTEIKRTTVYEVVDSLVAKGLMKKEIHGFKTLYSPEHPERLENALETKRALLARVLPELEGIFNLKGTEGAIKYYEGLQSIRNIYDDLLKDLKPHEYYYAISNVLEWYGAQGESFIEKHVEDRSHMRINTKLLFIDSPVAQMRKKTERNFNEEVKILPEGSEFNVDLVITPHKLVMFQLKNPLVAIVIENKSIIGIQKAMFEIIWKSIQE